MASDGTAKAVTPTPIQPASGWSLIAGAIFGGVTLLGFFLFAFLAGTSGTGFVCNSFELLAAVFSLGAALSAGFIGGGARAQGSPTSAFAFGVGGGVAVLLISFVAFSYFKPKNCETFAMPIGGSLEVANQQLAALDTALASAYQFASGARDNSSDAPTCSSHGATAMGFVQSSQQAAAAIRQQLAQIAARLPPPTPAPTP